MLGLDGDAPAGAMRSSSCAACVALLLGGLVACTPSTAVDEPDPEGGTTEAGDSGSDESGVASGSTAPSDDSDSSSGEPGPPACDLSDDAFNVSFSGGPSNAGEATCVPGLPQHTSDEAGIPVTTITLHCGEDPTEPTGPDLVITGYWVDFGSEPVTLTEWNMTYETAGNDYIQMLRRDGRVLAMQTNWVAEWPFYVDVDMIYPDGDKASYEYNERSEIETIVGGSLSNLNGNTYLLTGIDTAPSG